MPVVGGRGAEETVRSVKVVEDAQHAVALGEFQVVKVMCFWRRQTGKVVAAVVVECPEDDQREPQPHGCQVRAHDTYTERWWEDVGYQMF